MSVRDNVGANVERSVHLRLSNTVDCRKRSPVRRRHLRYGEGRSDPRTVRTLRYDVCCERSTHERRYVDASVLKLAFLVEAKVEQQVAR